MRPCNLQAELGQRAAGQNHDEVLALLRQAGPDGAAIQRDLLRLLPLKMKAEYRPDDVPTPPARPLKWRNDAWPWLGALLDRIHPAPFDTATKSAEAGQPYQAPGRCRSPPSRRRSRVAGSGWRCSGWTRAGRRRRSAVRGLSIRAAIASASRSRSVGSRSCRPQPAPMAPRVSPLMAVPLPMASRSKPSRPRRRTSTGRRQPVVRLASGPRACAGTET